MVEEHLVNGTVSLPSQPTKRAPARIKIVGVGGGGCNCVRRMMRYNRVPGVSFAMVDTDIDATETSEHKVDRIQIGPKCTGGWSADGCFTGGPRAAAESPTGLRRTLGDADLVFVTAGMGGGTGTAAAPYVASLAGEMGAMVVGVVTVPFTFEGGRRRSQAMNGVNRLRPCVESLIVIHNDRMLAFADDNACMIDAFRTADEVVTQGIMGVSELINVAGEIKVEFGDVEGVLRKSGGALMAIGYGYGNDGPVEAVRRAMANPLLDQPITGAKGVLLLVKGGKHLTRGGVNAAGKVIANAVGTDASIFFGTSVDESMGEEVKLTVIATGLEQDISHPKPTSIKKQRHEETGGRHSKLKPPSSGGF